LYAVVILDDELKVVKIHKQSPSYVVVDTSIESMAVLDLVNGNYRIHKPEESRLAVVPRFHLINQIPESLEVYRNPDDDTYWIYCKNCYSKINTDIIGLMHVDRVHCRK